jgi:hypothetical protein
MASHLWLGVRVVAALAASTLVTVAATRDIPAGGEADPPAVLQTVEPPAAEAPPRPARPRAARRPLAVEHPTGDRWPVPIRNEEPVDQDRGN